MKIALALESGLNWLALHQSTWGAWDIDGFMHSTSSGDPCPCDGPGQEIHDVGVTGLALLAFLADGNSTEHGPYRDVVHRGVRWLRGQQDLDSGLVGSKVGHAFIYDHVIATEALAEACALSNDPILRNSAQLAVDYLQRARNQYSAWRYEVPPNGENDTSVTGWAVSALKAAEEAGLDVDKDAYAGALSWIDEVTHPATGRVGYDSIGSLPSRIPRVNDHFPPEKGESMTATGLLARQLMGQSLESTPVMRKHAKVILSKLPEWDPDSRGCDMYYWFYGSYALHQMGDPTYWGPWNQTLKAAALQGQRTMDHFSGSWDPVGPWGYAGGRVYSTAMMCLCLEVYHRRARQSDIHENRRPN